MDTDGGTVNDGVEVKRGTDPLNPNDDVVVASFESILFAFDSYKLDKVRDPALDNISFACIRLNSWQR